VVRGQIMIKQIITIIVVGLISFCVLSCSRTSSNMPVSPKDADDFQFMNDSYIPAPYGLDVNKSHVLWGIWDVVGELSDFSITSHPNREVGVHFNITQWIPAPTIYVRGFDKSTSIINLDIAITNPYAISGYDVRLIVYTDALGHKLTNADDWTSLYDLPGGLPINPFKAYAKSETNRKFAGGAQHTENCKIYLPGGNLHFTIAIDASFPTNCDEPYELTNFTQGIILDQLGSSTELEVTAHSWSNDVNSVKLYCPQITGTTLVSFSQIDPEKWGYTLTNNTGAASGNYFGYLIATTSKSGSLALYDEVTIKITPLNSGWARTWGGVGDDHADDVAVDRSGSIYVTGNYMSTVDFNPDPEAQDIRTSNGLEDAFLVKYDKYGNFLWAKTWGAESWDHGYAVDTDNSDNLFVSGIFSGTVDFGTSGNQDIKTANGAYDCFLTKYDSSGNYIWTRAWGGGGIESPLRIHVGLNNDVAVTGYFEGTADFNPDPTQTDMHSSNGGYDVFLSKFNSEGVFQWARTWGGNKSYMERGNGIMSDSVGNVYCSGQFSGTADFDPGSGTDIHTPVGSVWWDAFLSSFDSNGNFRWAHTWGSTYQDESNECAVDEFDDVYVVGNFYYTVDFNPDPLETEERTAVWESDVFVSKFAPDGDFKWVLTWGSTGDDKGLSISLDSVNNFWVRGDGLYSLAKFNFNADLIWSRWWSDVQLVPGGFDVDSSGISYMTGWYSGYQTLDFDPGPEKWYSQNYVNGWDCYIMKILPNGYWE